MALVTRIDREPILGLDDHPDLAVRVQYDRLGLFDVVLERPGTYSPVIGGGILRYGRRAELLIHMLPTSGAYPAGELVGGAILGTTALCALAVDPKAEVGIDVPSHYRHDSGSVVDTLNSFGFAIPYDHQKPNPDGVVLSAAELYDNVVQRTPDALQLANMGLASYLGNLQQ